MANQFEHLQLPKTNIQFPRRSQRGFSGGKRTNRSSHGSQLLDQVSGIINRPQKQYTPFGINPKLIFKIKLGEGYNLTEDQVTSSGLNLLAKESKKNNAIIVFPSDIVDLNHLLNLQEKLVLRYLNSLKLNLLLIIIVEF